jgi:plastocyanin
MMRTMATRRTTWITLGITALTLLLGLAACGGDDDDGGGGGAAEADVVIEGFVFTTETVQAGAEVSIVNEDSVTHTVTADDGPFDVEVGAGDTATFTAPDEPGDYAFHCNLHPQMTGTLTVE